MELPHSLYESAVNIVELTIRYTERNKLFAKQLLVRSFPLYLLYYVWLRIASVLPLLVAVPKELQGFLQLILSLSFFNKVVPSVWYACILLLLAFLFVPLASVLIGAVHV
jgi:hypothetical protein